MYMQIWNHSCIFSAKNINFLNKMVEKSGEIFYLKCNDYHKTKRLQTRFS